jgi:hypothetical protein
MRDFMKKEIVFYNIFNKLESVVIPSVGTKVNFFTYLKNTFLMYALWFIGFCGLYVSLYYIRGDELLQLWICEGSVGVS